MKTGRKITERELEKLAFFADMNLAVVLHPPPMMPAEYLEQCQKFFLTTHLFFVQLTLDALRDRELAEWLIPIFKRLDGQMVAYSDTLGILCDLLQVEHGIKEDMPLLLPADEVRSCVETWLKTELKDDNIFSDHEHFKKKQTGGEENIMFR
jgi:hypothetical protein